MAYKLLLGAGAALAIAAVLVRFPATDAPTGGSRAAFAEGVGTPMLSVVSDVVVDGFLHPESVACDGEARILYVSEFGPGQGSATKDGGGRISRISLDRPDGDHPVVSPRGITLHRPKGLWLAGERLWVSDIDSVWIFDTGTWRARRLALPRVGYANGTAVAGDVLYVSDNRNDLVVSIEPADFLALDGEPRVTRIYSGGSVNPNGIHPASDGSLLMAGYNLDGQPRGIYALDAGGGARAVAEGLGRLDGIYPLPDGALLVTEWDTGSLALWSREGSFRALASGFQAPADFCAMETPEGLLVAVPDLARNEVRLIVLAAEPVEDIEGLSRVYHE